MATHPKESQPVIEFWASISDQASAITRSGRLEGGGAVRLDVPESEVAALARLMAAVLRPLKVRIEVAEGSE